MEDAITLRQLRYLVALADRLHFGRAAEACRVSQPSLSAQIQQLEALLGTPLVERGGRRVLLTAAGIEAAERARRILADVRDLAQAAARARAPLTGDVRLGVIPTVGPYLLPRVLPALREAHPELRLFLREDLTARLLERLRAGGLDVLLLALPVDEPDLDSVPVFDEAFLVALPAGHPLAGRAVVRERDLAGERLLLLEDGHCFRDQALRVCGQVPRGERETFGATSLDTLREMVANRIGITLLPALATTVPGAAKGQIALRPLAAPAPGRRIGLAWRRHDPGAADYRRLAELLRAHLPEGATPVEG